MLLQYFSHYSYCDFCKYRRHNNIDPSCYVGVRTPGIEIILEISDNVIVREK